MRHIMTERLEETSLQYALHEIVRRIGRHPILGVKYLLGCDPSRIPVALISRFVDSRMPIVIEAGSYDGQDTERFLDRWPNAHVYAFEPIPQLNKNLVDRFALDSRVSVINFALVGNRCEETSMYTFSSEECPNGSSSLFRPSMHTLRAPDIDLSVEVIVPAITLDDWFHQSMIDRCDLLWLDLQGAELEVLQAGTALLRRTKALHLEVSDEPLYEGAADRNDLQSFLKKFGFKLVARRQLGINGNELYVNAKIES